MNVDKGVPIVYDNNVSTVNKPFRDDSVDNGYTIGESDCLPRQDQLAVLEKQLSLEIERISQDDSGEIKKIERTPSVVAAARAQNNEHDEIPGRFLRGVLGDPIEARKRWEATKLWRVEQNIDRVLDCPQPYFNFIKKHYPHFVHKLGTSGNYVYVEQMGKGNIDMFWKNNIGLDELAKHYVFVTEFIWNIVDPREDGMLLSIFDLKGTSMQELAGNSLKLFKRCSQILQAHYPERSYRMFIINAPWWFQTAFSVVSPFIDPRTKKKISVLGKDYTKALLEEIPANHLPVCYGGTDVDDLGHSTAECLIAEHVKRVNSSHGVVSFDAPVKSVKGTCS